MFAEHEPHSKCFSQQTLVQPCAQYQGLPPAEPERFCLLQTTWCRQYILISMRVLWLVMQVCLYDVRRLSSSIIINFGSSKSSQQLLMTHNLKSRAQAAGHGSGSCTMYGVACEPQFLCDVVVNPVDPTLLAYVKPQLQVRVEVEVLLSWMPLSS